MIWILEADVFGVPGQPLADAARRRQHAVVTWRDEWWAAPAQLPPATGEALVFHGSLGNAGRIAALGRWRPGAYCATRRFSCSAWYPLAARWLANPQVAFTTVRALTASPERVAAAIAVDGRVFVRPDSPLKPFAGRVVALEGLTPAALDHGFYYDDLDLPVVVAPVQSLGAEWRFVVVDRAVVAASAYVAEGRRARAAEVPVAARALAAEIAAELAPPDPVYALDLVETDRGIRLVELNPFSGVDLYGCDRDAVVAAVQAIA